MRERLSEVGADAEEAYRTRGRFVELLVAGIVVGRKRDGSSKTEITYRFGSPELGEGDAGELTFVGGAHNALS